MSYYGAFWVAYVACCLFFLNDKNNRRCQTMEKIFTLYIVIGILLFLANCIFTGIIVLIIKTGNMDFESIIICIAVAVGAFFVSGMVIYCGYTQELKFLRLGIWGTVFVISATALIHNN